MTRPPARCSAASCGVLLLRQALPGNNSAGGYVAFACFHLFWGDPARNLIEESGFDTSRTIQWLYWGKPDPYMLAIKDYWEQVGIKTEFDIIDPSAIMEVVYGEMSQELMLDSMGGFQDLNALWIYFKCGWTYDTGGYNAANICDPELDALVEKALAAETDEELRERWLDVSRRWHGRGTMVAGLLWSGVQRYLYHRRVNGAYWQQKYVVPVRPPIERVWLDPRWDKNKFVG